MTKLAPIVKNDNEGIKTKDNSEVGDSLAKTSMLPLFEDNETAKELMEAEEGKLCKSWNKAQQAQWACWRVQDVHIHMPNEGRAHPFAWAATRDEGPDLPITFQETCSTSKRGLFSKPERLVQQVWVTSSASL